MSTSACHAAEEILSLVLFLQKDQAWQIFTRMINTALLEAENIGAEDPVATLATFHLAGFASEQFFPVVVSQKSISICNTSGVPWSPVFQTSAWQDRQVYGHQGHSKAQ